MWNFTADIYPLGGSSTHLRHHHKGMLIGTEVWDIKHGIGIEDAHHGDMGEVESLSHHLCPDENLCALGREVVDDTLIGIT